MIDPGGLLTAQAIVMGCPSCPERWRIEVTPVVVTTVDADKARTANAFLDYDRDVLTRIATHVMNKHPEAF